MKIIFLFFLILISCDVFSQKKDEKNILGKYAGNNNCSISDLVLTLNKNHKFETIYNGHYRTNKKDIGKWKMKGDTLLLKYIKENELRRFILLNGKFCDLDQENILCERFCLTKE